MLSNAVSNVYVHKCGREQIPVEVGVAKINGVVNFHFKRFMVSTTASDH